MSQVNLINKTNISDIIKELTNCVLTYDYLCLARTQKWCSELLFSLEDSNSTLNHEQLCVDFKDFVGVKDFTRFQLARSYFNLKEYLRASFYLQDCESSPAYFLYVYSKYMAIMKKSADNKPDLLNNIDPACMDSLQNLRSELSSKHMKNQLDSYSLYVYGIVLSKLKLNEEAINVLISSIKKKPTSWCCWLELANLIKSIETLNSLHTALPQNWMKDLFLAHCYIELSLSEEALNIYFDFTNKGFSKSIYIKSQMAKCYDNLREGQECKLTFEAIRKMDAFNLDLMDIYSNILFVLEEHAQLAILAQEACEIDKYRPESCCIIGNYYSLQNEHHKAVNYFQRALKLNPSYLQAWILIGHEFMELKNSTSAIQSYTNAIELNPKDYRAWYGLGQTYEILKLYSYCLYYYKQAYLLRPNDSRFIVALADVYVKLEKWDEAKRCYIKAYSVGDYEGSSLCKLAKVYEKLNEPLNVAIAYDQFTEDQKALRRANPAQLNDLSQAYKFLANFYLKKMKLDNAYEAATKCLEFAETRQEAQSILNQIAQTRNSLREQELTLANPAVVDMEIVVTNTSVSNTSNIPLPNVSNTTVPTTTSTLSAGDSQNTDTLNAKNELGLSSSLLHLDSSDNQNSNNSIATSNATTSSTGNMTSAGYSESSNIPTTSGISSQPRRNHINEETDSESDQFFSDFNIKRSNKKDH